MAKRADPQALGLRAAWRWSLGLHVAAAAILWLLGLQSGSRSPAPQRLLTTHLVRLGPQRSDKLLPTLAASAPRAPKAAAAVPKAAPAPTPAAKPPAPLKAAAAAGASGPTPPSTQSALDRLRREVAGATDGSALGDTDVAAAGDRYASEVTQCLRQNWIIEGVDAQRVLGRHALVLIRIGPGGKILDHRILQGSGQAAIDNAVSRAVRRCGQVSPPPAAWRERLRRDGMEIDFSP